MASTSTSSVQKRFKYDVFISFRGEDTRNTFVGHLYNALKQKGFVTYMDDKKIEKGETIKNQLMKSIEESRFFIIVFSKRYASSSWCLDELAKIMERQSNPEQTAFPVFYDVEPTEVRKQSHAFGEAFKEHENKEAAAAKKWREALKEAANLAGWELKTAANGNESKLIEEVVADISKKLSSVSSSVDRKLVGMEMRIKELLLSLEICTGDEGRVLELEYRGEVKSSKKQKVERECCFIGEATQKTGVAPSRGGLYCISRTLKNGSSVSSESYSLDANLCLICLYQFEPERMSTKIVARILNQALMAMPAPDFSLCLFLIPERVQMDEQFKTLILLSHYLEEKTALIFCIEDRALFCHDCDEPIHSAGSLAANHQRFLATRIRVALSSSSTQEPEKNQQEPPPPSTKNVAAVPQVVPVKTPTHQISRYNSPQWAVDDLLQFSDFESSDKQLEFGELEWLTNYGVFGDEAFPLRQGIRG
ncbi:toll/interleukin-1 receptor (TIR) domain-containing protein [Artemisia annua]|uniref:Toll/interleukin-1 receptor (TIR) domain-containing protein n=1 Tax=Artemisia annua TaxID=35608 RepID=A0A2U1MMJ7_ARTAN|nr:toll/interleukin-1 receptor (TIR) domain-containing protein [Artemisia annua]